MRNTDQNLRKTNSERQRWTDHKPVMNSFKKLEDDELLNRGILLTDKGKIVLVNDHLVIPFKLDVTLMRSRSAILLKSLYNINFELTQNARNISLLYSIQKEIKILSDRLKSQINYETHMYANFLKCYRLSFRIKRGNGEK